MATSAQISRQLSMHSQADFSIERLSDQFHYTYHPSMVSPVTFLINFTVKYCVRSYHYPALPSQGEGNQILLIQYHDEPYGTEVCTRVAMPLDRLMCSDAWAAIRSELRLLDLSEYCHAPILNDLYSRLASIANSGGFDGFNVIHTVVRVDVMINCVLCWRWNRDSLIEQLNPPIPEPEIEPEVSARRSHLLERVKTEELELMAGEDCSCCICLEGLTGREEDEVLRLPCDHVFHGDCIFKWFEMRHCCPLCRFELPFSAAIGL
ncbi:hypothetical protein Ancab_029974 [Ancistrocladus abbreviatus]